MALPYVVRNSATAQSGLPEVTVLDLHVSKVAVAGDWALVLAFESSDLNGDGDSGDTIAHAVRLSTGEVRNLGLAVLGSRLDAVVLDATGVVLAVDERHQGGLDLNGDADALDSVFHVHEFEPNITTNTRLAAVGVGSGGVAENASAISREQILLAVDEESQGEDLDGDGDRSDAVVHVFDRETSSTRNLGLPVPTTYGPDVAGYAGGLIFTVDEEAFGGRDLNADGDGLDHVLHSMVGSAAPRNHGLAVFPGADFREGSLWFLVDELGQGGTDLNGDGDAADHVLHTIGPNGLTNLRLAVEPPSPSIDYTVQVAPGGTHAVFGVGELSQGGQDLNLDGDLLDRVPVVLDLVRGRAVSTGLAASANGFLGFPEPGGGAQTSGRLGVILTVWEWLQGGVDLNGDGDSLDYLTYSFDVRSGVSSSLELDQAKVGTYGTLSTEGVVLLKTDEADTSVDGNGDGDTADVLPVVLDSRSRQARVLELATFARDSFLISGFLDIHGRFVVFPVDERDQGNTDLNGDGDTSDWILFVHDTRSKRTLDTSISLSSPTIPPAGSQGVLAVPVSEVRGGVDLNQDGDQVDSLLLLVDLDALR